MTTDPTFGRYQLRGTLGQGGFATVYRAFDPGLNREVAIKALLPHLASDSEVRRRFIAEAQGLAQLHHPNIVAVYDVGEAQGRPFFAMELVAGDTLARLLSGGRRLEVAQALPIVERIADALDYLHQAGLVHRDVKPANVLVEPGGRIVLMDLGIARVLDDVQHTMTGMSLGTPSYMAPEQVKGLPVGPAADIYSLGIVTFQLLGGRPPFQGDTAFLLHAQAYEPPPPLQQLRPGLPANIYAAVEAALAKEPMQRPPTAGQFSALLSGTQEQTIVGPPSGIRVTAGASSTVKLRPPVVGPTALTAPPVSTRRVPRALIAVGALAAVLIVAAGVAFALFSGRGKGTSNHATDLIGNTNNAITQPTRQPPVPTSGSANVPPTATGQADIKPPPSGTAGSAAPAKPPSADFSGSSLADSAGQWGQGRSALRACITFQNAPAGAQVRLRVARTSAPMQFIAEGAPTPLGVASGMTCLAIEPGAMVPPDNYLASVVDERDRQYAVTGFVVPELRTPAPTRTEPPPTMTTTATTRLASPPDLTAAPLSSAGPAPRITNVEPLGPTRANGTFDFRVTARNFGVLSGVSSISISSSPAVALDADLGLCAPENHGKAQTYMPGQNVTSFASTPPRNVPATAWQVEAQLTAWSPNTECVIVVHARIGTASTLTFQLRATALASDGRVFSWPQTGATDQSSLRAVIWTVPVER